MTNTKSEKAVRRERLINRRKHRRRRKSWDRYKSRKIRQQRRKSGISI